MRLSSGDTVSALLASAAIPGTFPPVRREGRLLIDGGIAADTAIAEAIAPARQWLEHASPIGPQIDVTAES